MRFLIARMTETRSVLVKFNCTFRRHLYSQTIGKLIPLGEILLSSVIIACENLCLVLMFQKLQLLIVRPNNKSSKHLLIYRQSDELNVNILSLTSHFYVIT